MKIMTRNGARRTGRVVAAGAALALLAGCASQGPAPEALETPAPSGTDTDLRAAWWGGESRAELFDQIIDNYEATLDGPAFETSFTAFDQYFPQLATQAAGKDLPDVLFITERQISDFAPALLDLQPYVNVEQLDLTDFSENFIQAGKVGDELKMMAVGATYPTIQFNQTLFDEAGIDYPSGDWTWDDVKDIAIELSDALGPNRWGMQDSGGVGTLFENFLLQRDKTLFTGDELNFEESDLADWLGLWEDLRASGATPPGQVTVETASNTFENSLFGTDKVAMFYTSHNQLPTFQGFMADDVISLAPDPIAGDTRTTLIIGTFMSVAGNTGNADAAVGLLNYWVNDPEAIELFGAQFGSPASAKAVEQISANASPALAKLLEFGTTAESFAQVGSPRPKGGTEVESIIARANEAVASGALSVDDAAKEFYLQAEDAVR
ncbi:extracellular solute-binding protein [soil metagenome]